ncbi:MAG: GNAT family N-acetyltransferase [Flavobacteriales bacterium]|nr:GNAT family N-acetyltransferase [Flavobacteriales bacterium]
MKEYSVRLLEVNDIDRIADYWLLSDSDYLTGLGVDLQKLPSRDDFRSMLEGQLGLPNEEKQAFALIWMEKDAPIGHCNINGIRFGEEAYMHLHLWNSRFRRKGAGEYLVRLSIPIFFDQFKLKRLICMPYALNEAPNRVLAKLGFELVQELVTVPGSINFEQPVKKWVLSREVSAKTGDK